MKTKQIQQGFSITFQNKDGYEKAVKILENREKLGIDFGYWF